MNAKNTSSNPGRDSASDQPNITQQNRGERQDVRSADQPTPEKEQGPSSDRSEQATSEPKEQGREE